MASFKREAKALLAAAVWLASALACPALAQQVTSDLSMVRVLTRPDGSEQLHAAREVRPGDLLQYTATYRNDGQRPVKQLVATLPIPAGTEFVSAPGAAGQIQASLGGTVFEPIPLMRKQRQADGQWLSVPVPLAEYRTLRWPGADLSAGGSLIALARVRVVTQAPAVTAVSSPAPAKALR